MQVDNIRVRVEWCEGPTEIMSVGQFRAKANAMSQAADLGPFYDPETWAAFDAAMKDGRPWCDMVNSVTPLTD